MSTEAKASCSSRAASLQELLKQQKESLRDTEIVVASDYLALAKPIKAADGSSPSSRSRSGTGASRPATAGAPVALTAVAADGSDVETRIGTYNPGSPNRHLHIRDTLVLALRVLEVNKRDGHSLTPAEQQLVNAISAFATVSS
jgi:hypothetical protein